MRHDERELQGARHPRYADDQTCRGAFHGHARREFQAMHAWWDDANDDCVIGHSRHGKAHCRVVEDGEQQPPRRWHFKNAV